MEEVIIRYVKGKIRAWKLKPKGERSKTTSNERLGKGELAKFPKYNDPYMKVECEKDKFVKMRKKNGVGKVYKDKDLNIKTHLSELFTASWMANEFGTDIKIIQEGNDTAYVDLEWGKKLWEVKVPKSLRAIDNRIQDALDKMNNLSDKDIKKYEGIILNLNIVEGSVRNNTKEEIIKVVKNRLMGFAQKKMYVLIKQGNELLEVVKIDYK